MKQAHTIIQRIAEMQSELQQSIDHGEEQEFIDNFAKDLNQLLIDAMYEMVKPSTAGAA